MIILYNNIITFYVYIYQFFVYGMILYNKTILLPSNLQALYNLLQNNDDDEVSMYSCKCIFSDRIACKHYIRSSQNHIIQIWKTKSIFDYWFDGFGSRNFIACIHYTIHDTYIKIVHLGIRENSLDEYDAEDIVKHLVNFVKLVAIQENKTKIILDVHENLRIFLKYYYYIGFTPVLLEEGTGTGTVTGTIYKKCIDNPFWIETELIL